MALSILLCIDGGSGVISIRGDIGLISSKTCRQKKSCPYSLQRGVFIVGMSKPT